MSSLGAAPYQGVRGIALSGALHGTLGLNESIYVNPAAFAFAQRYSVEAHSFLAQIVKHSRTLPQKRTHLNRQE